MKQNEVVSSPPRHSSNPEHPGSLPPSPCLPEFSFFVLCLASSCALQEERERGGCSVMATTRGLVLLVASDTICALLIIFPHQCHQRAVST